MSLQATLVMRGTAFAVAEPRTALPCELTLQTTLRRPAGRVVVVRCVGDVAFDEVLPVGRADGHLEITPAPRPSALLELAIRTEDGPFRLRARWAPTPLHPIISLTRLLGALEDHEGATVALVQLHFDTRRDLASLLASARGGEASDSPARDAHQESP